VQVTAYGRQTVSDRGVVRSQNFGDPIMSLERLNLKSSNQRGYINSSKRMTCQQKGRGYGHVIVLKFCRLSSCSASRGFVRDSWAFCVLCRR